MFILIIKIIIKIIEYSRSIVIPLQEVLLGFTYFRFFNTLSAKKSLLQSETNMDLKLIYKYYSS